MKSRLEHLRLVDDRLLHAVWEEVNLRKVLAHCAADCVFDVGANQGQYAEMLRNNVGFQGLIISFEPLPEAAELLRTKAARVRGWAIEPLAIGGIDGSQSFNVMRCSQFSSLSAPRHDVSDLFVSMNDVERVVTVPTERLATAYHRLKERYRFTRPFLKMDTQGSDVDIVRASEDVIREFIGLQSELSIKQLYSRSVDFREAISYYQSCGFELAALVPNNAGHFPHFVETDCLMIRSDLVPQRSQQRR